MKRFIIISLFMFVIGLLDNCSSQPACHNDMVSILQTNHENTYIPTNQFYPLAGLSHMDSLLGLEHSTPSQIRYCKYLKSNLLLELGREDQAIELFEELTNADSNFENSFIWKDLALAYLRQGERSNCISNHAAESCIIPVRRMGIHQNRTGSENAIRIYEKMLSKDSTDLESRWLLNLAYMTLGRYPLGVPPAFLLPGMEGDTTEKVKPFEDIASGLKLDVKNMAGGIIIEDFDNDGYLDIMTSCMDTEEKLHYFKNNANGTFSDLSDQTGLAGISGGLNIMQTDYNNDGFKDVLVLRGGWKKEFGKEPNSLLRNNGNGSFTDVTTQSGLLSFHPTQTATWNDFNNDGWLDLFIGNESVKNGLELHPCELYINNQDGTFREVAKQSNCAVVSYVKGVTSGDFDHDGWKDIFISTMDGQRKLLKNMGGSGKTDISFSDVTKSAGLDKEHGNTFPTWFWDFDNDGWLDIYACDYTFQKSLGYYEAAEKLNIQAGSPEKMLLYRNNHDGTFTNVANEMGLNHNAFAMGSNFGDIDNDGFLDMYLGTGNPDYKSLVPNKMFKNNGGKRFADVTASARVGHLQKGHGISFADLDNDGDQDIYAEMGGAYAGDSYPNSFFLNPGQNNNHWITLTLEGTTSNRAAIGSTVKITFKDGDQIRTVYRDVNSGGSFGASPLRREVGVGSAEVLDEIEIRWHGSKKVTVLKNIRVDQFLKINEDNDVAAPVKLKVIDWIVPDKLCPPTIAMTN